LRYPNPHHSGITMCVPDSAHRRSDSASRRLCDLVLEATRAEISDIVRSESKNWCTFAQSGHSKGFYVRHVSRTITVYPRWDFIDAEDLQKAAAASGFQTGTRRSMEDTWAKRYPVPIKVLREADVGSIVPLVLHAVSQTARADSASAYRGLRFAQEMEVGSTYPEGSTYTIVVNAYERNPSARLACISYYGARCSVCDFDFGTRYGEIGEGFIHVHHLLPLSSLGQEYKVDPKQHLRPVCPNCHEMLHRRRPPYSIEELKRTMQHQGVTR
jgi:HNH endonuclease